MSALLGLLDDPERARRWLAGLGVRDVERGWRDLRDLVHPDRPRASIGVLLSQLEQGLPSCPDPGMALTNLERFLAAAPLPAATLGLLALDPRTFEVLLQLFSASQYLSDQMIGEPELIHWLRAGAGRRDRDHLIAGLQKELSGRTDDESWRLALRKFRHREMLLIGHNDIVLGQSLEVVTTDLSNLAEACVEAAYQRARARAIERFGEALGPDGRPSRFVVLAMGKLGGQELNYSSDIDLLFLYDREGATSGPRQTTNEEFHSKVGGELVRLLADHTALGRAYRVDLRLRPDGDQGPLVRSLAATLGHYETKGRTWERQALIKCRPIAGDLGLGRQFLAAITPFVYRRYLSAAEIGEIKAIKRKIEARTLSAGTQELEVKTGRGGIRDVEFVVQFLQLLHGGTYPQVRHHNTIEALTRLEQLGCLTAEERGIMEDTYRFLRRVEHRLQAMFDRQTHQMPADPEGQRALAIRMGYHPRTVWEDRAGPAQRFVADYRAKTEFNRRILNHLLHDAFRDDSGAPVDPVVDLVLDPDPAPETIAAALGRYPFHDGPTAHRNLLALAREDTPFLSQARCRHFFAAIAPRLLDAVAATAEPDMTLTNLEKVSASLGAKAVLWELFSFNPPTLRLYVELCASSQFLTEILINNPGMIDDLMDSLVVDRSQPASAIRLELAELCRGAEDLGPILMGFRNKELIRIGTRDVLRREPIRDVTRELADVAESIVDHVARDQFARRVRRHGSPRLADQGRAAHWAILALGRLGGRELSYHSDLDLVFIHQGAGRTDNTGEAGPITNEQFFAEVAQRALRALEGGMGQGPLYAIDTRLRPQGASGPLTVTLETFRDYYRGPARAWERLALTRARVVHARGDFGREVASIVREVLTEAIDVADLALQVRQMRRRVEEGAPPHGLRRGYGGLAEIEFLVQFLQLVHAPADPRVLKTNIWEALDALRDKGVLDEEEHASLTSSYDFRRTVEARLRLVHNRARVEVPREREELARLARRLGYDGASETANIERFLADAKDRAERTRALFEKHVAPAGPAG